MPLDPAGPDGTGDHADDSLSIFQQQLHDSVEAHLMADVPLGLFFSGGVDPPRFSQQCPTCGSGRRQRADPDIPSGSTGAVMMGPALRNRHW